MEIKGVDFQTPLVSGRRPHVSRALLRVRGLLLRRSRTLCFMHSAEAGLLSGG